MDFSFNIVNNKAQNEIIYTDFIKDLMADYKISIETENSKGQRSLVIEIPTNVPVVNVSSDEAAAEVIYRIICIFAKNNCRTQLLPANKLLVVWFKQEDVLHKKKRTTVLEYVKLPISERFKSEKMATPIDEISEIERVVEETYYQSQAQLQQQQHE